MFIIIFCFFAFLLIISSYIKQKLARKLVRIYLLWWFWNLSISSLNPFNLYEVRLDTYILILLNVLFFTIGFLVKKTNKKIEIKNDSFEGLFNRFEDIILNKRLLYTLIPFTIYIVLKLIKYISLLPVLTESDVRMVKYKVGLLFNSGQEIIFFNYFIETVAFFTSIFISYCVVFKRFRFKVFYVSSIFYLSYAVIGAGRGPFIMLLFYILFFAIIKKELVIKTYNAKSKKNFISLFLFIFFVITMSFQTAYRAGHVNFNLASLSYGATDLSRHFIVYCVGSFRALEYAIDNYSYLQYSGGQFSLMGLEDIFLYFTKVIGFNYESFGVKLFEVLTSSFVISNDGGTFNALFTAVFPFYTDFGILGVVIFSFSFGFFYKSLVLDFLNNKNIYSLMAVLLLSVIAIYTIFTWKFSSASPYIILAILYWKRRNIKFK